MRFKLFEEIAFGREEAYDKMYNVLKKKMGVRALDREVMYRSDYSRFRQLNHSMLTYLYTELCLDNHDLVDDQNAKIVFGHLNPHTIGTDEKAFSLVKNVVEKFNPTQYEIASQFKDFAKSERGIKIADFLFDKLSDKEAKNLAEDNAWSNGFVSGKEKIVEYLYDKGLLYFDDADKAPRGTKIWNSSVLKWINNNESDSLIKKVLSDPKFKPDVEFFQKMIKHPNNGGINSSDERFSKKLEKLCKYSSIKSFIENHIKEIGEIKSDGWGKGYADFLPAEFDKIKPQLKQVAEDQKRAEKDAENSKNKADEEQAIDMFKRAGLDVHKPEGKHLSSDRNEVEYVEDGIRVRFYVMKSSWHSTRDLKEVKENIARYKEIMKRHGDLIKNIYEYCEKVGDGPVWMMPRGSGQYQAFFGDDNGYLAILYLELLGYMGGKKPKGGETYTLQVNGAKNDAKFKDFEKYQTDVIDKRNRGAALAQDLGIGSYERVEIRTHKATYYQYWS